MHLLITILVLSTAVAHAAVPTAATAVVGRFEKGPVDVAVTVNAAEFDSLFGADDPTTFPAEIQARQFFRNGGGNLSVVRVDPEKPLDQALPGNLTPPNLTGLGALLPLSNLGILVCPELTTLAGPAIALCLNRIEALGADAPLFTVLDPPSSVTTVAQMVAWRQANLTTDLANVALYFPRLSIDPATWSGGSSAVRITTGASGTMAAVIKKYDAARGIWKPPAGETATLITDGFEIALSTPDISSLTLAGINPLRDLASNGPVAWGARTLSEDAEDKYIATARTRRWIHRSLERELSDAALQDNGTALWTSLRIRTESFLHPLYLSGAFAGTTQQDAYFVHCDSSTTSIADINAHRVNVVTGFSLVRPAEFTIETIQLATLNPALPAPAISLLISRPFSGKFLLSYPTIPGFDHSLLSSGSMAAGTWFDPGPTAGDGTWKRVTVPTADLHRFFRVKTSAGW